MEHLLVILAVWFVVEFAEHFIDASTLFWRALALVLGLIGSFVFHGLTDPELLVLFGVGYGGGAVFTRRLHDTLLVTGDWVTVRMPTDNDKRRRI